MADNNSNFVVYKGRKKVVKFLSDLLNQLNKKTGGKKWHTEVAAAVEEITDAPEGAEVRQKFVAVISFHVAE